MKILYEDIISTYGKIKPFLKITETSYSEQISKKLNCNLFSEIYFLINLSQVLLYL